LILCLEVEVIKRLLQPLNELAVPFKKDKKQQKIVKTAKNDLQLTSLIALRAREKFKKQHF